MSERRGERPCAGLGERLSAFLDGELAGRAAEEVRAHLAGCARCREELEAMRGAEASLGETLVAESRAAEPGEGYWREFAGRVGTRIAGEERERRRPRLARGISPRQGALAGAAAVCLLAALLVTRQEQPYEPPGHLTRASEEPPAPEPAIEDPAPPPGSAAPEAAREAERPEPLYVRGTGSGSVRHQLAKTNVAARPAPDDAPGVSAELARDTAPAETPSPEARARSTLELLAGMKREAPPNTAILLPMLEQLARQPLPDSLAAAVREAVAELGGVLPDSAAAPADTVE